MKLKYLIMLLAWIFAITVSAASSPVAMLQSATDQVLTELSVNKATLQTKPEVVRSIINRCLLPHLALDNMARSAVSKDAWSQATSAQRQQFTQQFKKLLINTYSSALASYKDQKVQYLPMRSDTNNSAYTQVESKIIRNDGPPISVNYQLVLIGEQWLVYDFSVNGVSMLNSFRSQFADKLAQKGMDGFIKSLTEHNTQQSNT